MTFLRWLETISRRLQKTQRFYAQKTFPSTVVNMNQVHKEILRYVSPQASIKVDSDINVKIYTADVHNYPDGDALVAELHGGPAKNCTASMEVTVNDDEDNVEVVLRKLEEFTDFHCELAIPIKASLNVNAHQSAIVENTYGCELKVKAAKSINIKNAYAEKIDLLSTEGDIICKGILLGKHTTVETQNKGNINLDKIQGSNMKCKTAQGNISTNCSYVDSSEFHTDTGNLDLRNIHKQTKVYVHQKGDLKMTGVHGNLKALINEGNLNLQLSELEGDNTIEANNLSSCLINISNNVEENTSLDISLVGDANASISLDSSLEHLSPALANDKQQLKWPLDTQQTNKLKVVSKSSLTLGKLSWADFVRKQMEEPKE